MIRILTLALIGLLVQFALNAIVFHTPWYSQYIEPESFAGSYEAVLRNESTRPLRGPYRVLVLGDSAIAEGFSAPLANQSIQDSRWNFSSAGTPAATPRAWFYLLRDLDPLNNRYNVIVLPVTDYVDADGLEPPDIDIEADRDLDLNRLIVRLRLSDAFSFPFTFRDRGKQLRALAGSLFKGLIYSRDVQDFLREPSKRLEKVELFREHSRAWKDDYRGQESSLEGLHYDPARNKFEFPPHISPEIRKALQDRYQPERIRVAGYRRSYRARWLGGIVDRYRGTGAKIVFFRVPFRPFPLNVAIPTQGPTFLEQVKTHPDVLVLKEREFSDLETPALFFDPWHLNARGRAAFTPRLARAVAQAVGESGANTR